MDILTSQKLFFIIGSLFGFLAVAAGAFGSHLLKQKLSPDMLVIFEVGVRYQMYHALALIAVAFAYLLFQSSLLNIAGWSFIVGIVLFSGSLYTLALTGIRSFGAITPFGGVLYLIGWLCLALTAFKGR